MRDLRLPVRYKALLPLAEGDWEEGAELRKLSGRINSAALAIEDVIVEIVSKTMLREVKDKRGLVIGALLKTDSCSFSAKRKLLNVCIDSYSLLNAKQRNDLDQYLAKVSSYRNAFAHGDLVHNGFNHELHYFQGQPHVAVLDDTFFDALQEKFLSAWELIETAQTAANRVGS
jgi:hypothetical protein